MKHRLGEYIERAPTGTNFRDILEAWESGTPPTELWPEDPEEHND